MRKENDQTNKLTKKQINGEFKEMTVIYDYSHNKIQIPFN